MEICAKLSVSNPQDHITLLTVLKTLFVIKGQVEEGHEKHSCMAYLNYIDLQTIFQN